MIYKQGDERTFDQDSEEFKRLQDVAVALTRQSPNKHFYTVRDAYLDYGQDWKWTTIIDTAIEVQILNPRDWLDIVNGTPTSDMVNTLINGDYWPDKDKS